MWFFWKLHTENSADFCTKTRPKSETLKFTLSTRSLVFPSYQGESTIFEKGNFLYQIPDTKNWLRFKRVILPHPPLSRSKKGAHSKIIQTQQPYKVAKEWRNIPLCHAYQLSPSNQSSHTIFEKGSLYLALITALASSGLQEVLQNYQKK